LSFLHDEDGRKHKEESRADDVIDYHVDESNQSKTRDHEAA